MSDAYESIRKGLREALEYSQGGCPQAIVHDPLSVDVKNIRAKVGVSQIEFANIFGISVSTLQHWERGDRAPHGPALVLLNLIDRDPKCVFRSLCRRKG